MTVLREELSLPLTVASKSLTRDSQERSKIYQVVEAERRAKPDAKKSSLNK